MQVVLAEVRSWKLPSGKSCGTQFWTEVQDEATSDCCALPPDQFGPDLLQGGQEEPDSGSFTSDDTVVQTKALKSVPP